ncbi:AAA family ATPase [Paenibacillus sp. strain BS8-2]
MKLIEARIDGFGELNDRSINLDAPVIVVYGPNEAGKSTVFGYLRTMLYGFSRRASTERHEPTRGGKHGGRLLFADVDGQSILLERYAGSAGGKPAVRVMPSDLSGSADLETAQVKTLEQASWEQRYLGGVQERLYRQLYAVTLTELMEVGTLSGAELSRYLYQAGWEEGRAVAAAEKRIQADMDELYKPRGSNQRLNGHVKTIEKIDAELRGLSDDIERFNELTRDAEDADREIAMLEQSVPAAEERVRLLRKASAARPLWLCSRVLLAEAEQLQYTAELPQEAAAEWQALMTTRAQYEAEETRLRKELEHREARLALIEYDEILIAKGAECEALLQTAERMRSISSQRGEWQAELDVLDETIAKIVAGISPEWTEKQLRELVVTVADRDYVREMRERLEVNRRQEEKLQHERDGLHSQQHEAMTIRDEAETALRHEVRRRDGDGNGENQLLPRSSSELTTVWTAVDEALHGWELEQARIMGDRAGRPAPSTNKQLDLRIWGIGGIGAAAALGVGAATGLLGEMTSVALFAAFLLFGASTVFLIAGRRGGDRPTGETSRRSTRGLSNNGSVASEERLAGELARLVHHPAALLDDLLDMGAGSLRPGIRSALQSRVNLQVEQFTRQERIQGKISEVNQRLARLAAALQEKERSLTRIEDEKRDLEAAWREWLSARALPVSLSPAAALETFELAASAMDRLRQYDRLAARISAAEAETARYSGHAARLCEGFVEAQQQVQHDPTLALALLQSESRRHEGARAGEEALRVEVGEVTAALAEIEQLQLSNIQSIRSALSASHAASEAEYAAALQDQARLGELRLELTKLELEIGAGQTPERLAELEMLWHSCDELVLQQELQGAEDEAGRLAEMQNQLLEKRGRLKQAMEHLMNEEKRSELLAERAMTAAALEEGTDRYAILAISRELLRTTRQKFELERQPTVLRNAALYMNQLSQGRYVRVIAGGQDAGIAVERVDGAILDSGLLSRGTAEQLYLSMRLALAEEAAGTVELPMLLDDLFVNFDKTRLHAAAELMNAISSRRQLILFTCHEHIREALLAACPEAKLVNMIPQQTR